MEKDEKFRHYEMARQVVPDLVAACGEHWALVEKIAADESLSGIRRLTTAQFANGPNDYARAYDLGRLISYYLNVLDALGRGEDPSHINEVTRD